MPCFIRRSLFHFKFCYIICSHKYPYLLYTYRDLRAKKHRDKNNLFALEKPADWSYDFFFTSEKRRIDALIGYIIMFTREENRVARSPLLLSDQQHISKSLGAFFFRKMASNQSNRFQSLDSSIEEFIDGQENENTKKKTKHDVALFHEFLVLKGETRQMDELAPQELNKFLSEILITVRKEEDNGEYEPNSLGHSSLALSAI